MIKFLRGRIFEKLESCIVLDTGNIGYQINLPLNSPFFTAEISEEVLVYTELIVREDDMSLYGFSHKDELELFKLLITVNGVGAKAAMAIMSILPQEELRRAVATGDSKAISAANGIGKKTSERIILELKDKVGEFVTEEDKFISSDVTITGNRRSEAVNALLSLGYNRGEAETAVSRIKEDDLTVEEYIMFALRKM